MQAARQSIISQVGVLMELGVLQQGDLERVEKALPEVSGIGTLVRGNQASRQGYLFFQELFQKRLDEQERRTRNHPGFDRFRPPAAPEGAF